jgi:alkanesulfonate monooxygenase SsuD/methylene tetrahydromethanopterin reductase-like flavin-dependent oxidoreductase (luciferase family)
VKFGIFDHMEFRSDPMSTLYDERLDMLERADQAGFWCYHKAEHHFIHLDAAPSANVFLAALSQRTTNLRLGSLVYLLPFYEPLRLIEEICMLDHLSNGRLEIGVGKGISPAEHRLWGMDPDDARARFEETFSIVRAGLSETVLNHQGARHTYTDVEFPHRSLQTPHPGFWYPGNVDYAGRHRLNTITGGPTEMVANSARIYKDLLAQAEHDWNPGVAQPTIGVTRHVFVAPSDALAVERARSAYKVYNRNLAYLFKKYDVPFATGDPSFGGDADLAMSVEALVAGSPETIRQHIENVRDKAGIDYFVGAFAWGDLSHAEVCESQRLFSDEVMPAFR